MGFIKRDQPGNFALGPILLDIPPENIQISRHENHQFIQYLRHEHSIKIPSGRSAVRVDISFKLICEDDLADLETLQLLMGATRVTPFVPVTNAYLAQHLPLYLGEELENNGAIPDSIPMAIFGMSMIVGGDSPEVIECSMSLLYWNPMPFMGGEALAWTSVGRDKILEDIKSWVTQNITNKMAVPTNPKQFLLRWFNLKTYSELLNQYPDIKNMSSQASEEELKDIKQSNNADPDYIPDLESKLQAAADIYQAHLQAGRLPNFELAKVTSEFGPRKAPTSGASSLHKGIDLAAKIGTPVGAILAGTVLRVGNQPKGAGNYIVISHADGYESKYFHLSQILVKPGDYIGKGGIIGKSGNTGVGTGPHLHFELRQNGNLIDPGPWLVENQLSPLSNQFISPPLLASTVGRIDPNTDLVEQAIEKFYLQNRPNQKQELQDVINNYWHNGILPQDPELRKYLAQTFRITGSGPRQEQYGLIQPKGPEYQTSYGKVLGKQSFPFIDPLHIKELALRGWRRTSDDIRPLDPLFENVGNPNILDMTPHENPATKPQQVITSLSLSFQNRFAIMPITGWPYPTIQHMGAFDSEIRVSLALLAEKEYFPLLKQLNQMTHVLDKRSISYRSSIFTGKDAFALTKLSLDNRILNGLGIKYGVLTDLQAYRDQESPELVRVEFGLTENGLIDEELFGHYTYSDQVFRDRLFQWLVKKAWLNQDDANNLTSSEDSSVGLVPFAKKILALWNTQQDAYAVNKKKIDDAINGILNQGSNEILSRVQNNISKPTQVDVQVVRMRGGPAADVQARVIVKDQFGVTYQNIPLKVGPAAISEPVLYRDFLLKVDDSYCSTPKDFPVPTDPKYLIDKPFVEWAGDAWRYMFGGVPTADSEYPLGMAEKYLSGNYGANIIEAISNLNSNPPLSKEAASKTDKTTDDYKQNQAYVKSLLEWLRVWNEAHKDWYKTVIIENMLVAMSKDFDTYFNGLINEINNFHNRKSGCYRDLGLANDLTKNPYEWVDSKFGEQIAKSIQNLASNANLYVSGVLNYAKNITANYQDGGIVKDDWQKTLGNYKLDSDKLIRDQNSSIAGYVAGVDAYFEDAPNQIEQALESVKNISPVQFTVRKAFPAFKLYFVEEENGGQIKAFDEFYSYNAIIDWNLIEQGFHGAAIGGSTLVVTISNIFNHLDALVVSEAINMEGISSLGIASIAGGQQPVRYLETQGSQNKEVGLDGRVQPLQNIALKPGTKIVLKAGYNNDPARLKTIFAGQVTEIQQGTIMTIVAQGWESELMGRWDPEVDYPFSFWSIRKPFSAIEEDITGTAGTTQMMKSIMRHPQCKHFGHWQIGPANPFDLYTWSYTENKANRARANSDAPGGDRSNSNIRPSMTPFYSVYGLQAEIEKVKVDDRTLIDITTELKLRHPNNVLFVRPYGNGDATLYFGPPWGIYTTNDFVNNAGLFNYNGLQDYRFEAFKEIINRETTIKMNRVTYNEKTGILDGLDNDVGPLEKLWRSTHAFFAKDTGVTLQPIPIWAILQDPRIMTYLFKHTGRGEEYYKKRLYELIDAPGSLQALSWVMDKLEWITPEQNNPVGNVLSFNRTAVNGLMSRVLRPGTDERIIRLWFDALEDSRYIGIRDPSDKALWHIFPGYTPIHANVLNDVLKLINQEIIRKLQLIKEKAEKDNPVLANKLRVMDDLIEPVRKWHIVTSKNHIIANNIEVSSEFANQVKVGDQTVTFDPGMEDIRTRGFEAYETGSALDGFVASNLLAAELKKMYQGELILTGNPEIRPDDLIIILDDVRQIFGIVEVAKVVNSMSQEHGYITIVTPNLVVEVGDMTIAHAYQAFYSALSRDLEKLHDHSGKLGQIMASSLAFAHAPQTLGNIDEFTASVNKIKNNTVGPGPDTPGRNAATSAMGYGAWFGAAGSAMLYGAVGSATALAAPIVVLVGGAGLLIGGYTYISWQNNSIKEHAKSHPLTITPLVKRGLPMVAGIEGATGKTVVGQWGTNLTRGLRDYGKMIDVIAEVQSAVRGYREDTKTVDRLKDGTVDFILGGNPP